MNERELSFKASPRPLDKVVRRKLTSADKKVMDTSEEASDEIFTVESYFACCKEKGLSIDDLKNISIGMALDFQTDYVNLRSEKKDGKRRATQADFDAF